MDHTPAPKPFHAPTLSHDAAETLALQAMAFIAADEASFNGFLRQSGATPQNLKDLIRHRHFLAGVLAFVLERDSLLLDFCAAENLDPRLPERARQLLCPDSDVHFI